MTKGGLSEARTGRVIWKDVGKETFERFAQFAYTGDYSIPKTEKRGNVTPTPASPKTNGVRKRNGSEASASTVEPNEKSAPAFENELSREPVLEKADDDSGTILNYPTPSTKKNKKKKKPQATQAAQTKTEATIETESGAPAQQPNPEPATAKQVESQAPPTETTTATKTVEASSEPTVAATKEQEPESGVDFYHLSYPLLAERDNYHGTCEPSTEFEKANSYSKVLLCHAALYVLGDFQLVDSLKALALFKLHKTLCAFQLDKENINDITDLARYAYSDEGKGFDAGVGGLRALVCQYMAIHAQELGSDAGFMNLLAEGGQIVKDFFKFQLQKKN